MRYVVLLAIFVLGAIAGMTALSLLPDDVQQRVEDFHQEVRYTAGLDERPMAEGDVAPPMPSPVLRLNATTTPTLRPTTTSRATPALRATTMPRPTSTPRPTPTRTPRAGISDENLVALRYLAHRLINSDRADHGLLPVVLGTNPRRNCTPRT